MFCGFRRYIPRVGKFREFVDAFTDIKQLETEETNCRKLSAVLCTKFGEKLNKQHNKSYSFSFWRLILIYGFYRLCKVFGLGIGM